MALTQGQRKGLFFKLFASPQEGLAVEGSQGETFAPTTSQKRLRAMFSAAVEGSSPTDTITQGARLGNRININYFKKTTGDMVTREIRPYEFKGKYLYATDTLHGTDKIHSFITKRILDAEIVPGTTYKPVWPVKIE